MEKNKEIEMQQKKMAEMKFQMDALEKEKKNKEKESHQKNDEDAREKEIFYQR
jgi:hypothetical protein